MGIRLRSQLFPWIPIVLHLARLSARSQTTWWSSHPSLQKLEILKTSRPGKIATFPFSGQWMRRLRSFRSSKSKENLTGARFDLHIYVERNPRFYTHNVCLLVWLFYTREWCSFRKQKWHTRLSLQKTELPSYSSPYDRGMQDSFCCMAASEALFDKTSQVFPAELFLPDAGDPLCRFRRLLGSASRIDFSPKRAFFGGMGMMLELHGCMGHICLATYAWQQWSISIVSVVSSRGKAGTKCTGRSSCGRVAPSSSSTLPGLPMKELGSRSNQILTAKQRIPIETEKDLGGFVSQLSWTSASTGTRDEHLRGRWML